MGFFSKLKNAVTGGGAEVSIEVINPNLNEPFEVKIKASIKDSPIEIENGYLLVKGIERKIVEKNEEEVEEITQPILKETQEEEQQQDVEVEELNSDEEEQQGEVEEEEENNDEEQEEDEEDNEEVNTLVDLKIIFQEKTELNANQDYEWTASVTMPEGSKPTLIEDNYSLKYKIVAGLDTFGNDPDSGWKEVIFE